MPESSRKHTTTGTRSQERKSDSEIPSVSTPIYTDHLLLLKILHDCYFGSFKVRGIINPSTMSIHVPTLSSTADALTHLPKSHTSVLRSGCRLDNQVEKEDVWNGKDWVPTCMKTESGSK